MSVCLELCHRAAGVAAPAEGKVGGGREMVPGSAGVGRAVAGRKKAGEENRGEDLVFHRAGDLREADAVCHHHHVLRQEVDSHVHACRERDMEHELCLLLQRTLVRGGRGGGEIAESSLPNKCCNTLAV